MASGFTFIWFHVKPGDNSLGDPRALQHGLQSRPSQKGSDPYETAQRWQKWEKDSRIEWKGISAVEQKLSLSKIEQFLILDACGHGKGGLKVYNWSGVLYYYMISLYLLCTLFWIAIFPYNIIIVIICCCCYC